MANAHFMTDANRHPFLDNLVSAVGTVGLTVGLLSKDITAITTARTNPHNVASDKSGPFSSFRIHPLPHVIKFLQKEEVVGEISEVFVVTVLGKA